MNNYITLQDDKGNTAFFDKNHLLYAEGVSNPEGDEVCLRVVISFDGEKEHEFMLYYGKEEVLDLLYRIKTHNLEK